uniref:Lactose permease n=1 Tax=Clostridioides difficile TaxID=1496 RepID=A0A381ICA1_CLODI|nr:lactose permease [Clostridioides difficile]
MVAWTPWGKTTLGVTMLLAIGGGFSNVVSIINLNFFAGSCDYGHWKSGKDLPGLSMSLYPVAIQVGVLLATTIRTVLMNSMGYQADMVVTEAVKSRFYKYDFLFYGNTFNNSCCYSNTISSKWTRN